MSISIDVESIITPKEKHSWPALYAHQLFRVNKIKDIFGWENVPWEEPSNKSGLTATSSSWTTFSPLIGVSLAIINNVNVAEINIDQMLNLVIGEHEYNAFPHFCIVLNLQVFFYQLNLIYQYFSLMMKIY